MNSKPRVIKDYENLDPHIQEQLKFLYPLGFSESLISYTDKEGVKRSALPFETEDKFYLVRMTANEAMQIIDEDEDFDEAGELKGKIKQLYEEKFSDASPLGSDEDEEGEDDYSEEESHNEYV